MKTKQKIGRGIVGLALASGLSGCSEYGQAFSNQLIEGMVVQGAMSAVDEAVRTDIGGPRGTNVENNFYENSDNNRIDCVTVRVKGEDGKFYLEDVYGEILYYRINGGIIIRDRRDGKNLIVDKYSLIKVIDN